jgi:hypothetical protein
VACFPGKGTRFLALDRKVFACSRQQKQKGFRNSIIENGDKDHEMKKENPLNQREHQKGGKPVFYHLENQVFSDLFRFIRHSLTIDRAKIFLGHKKLKEKGTTLFRIHFHEFFLAEDFFLFKGTQVILFVLLF